MGVAVHAINQGGILNSYEIYLEAPGDSVKYRSTGHQNNNYHGTHNAPPHQPYSPPEPKFAHAIKQVGYKIASTRRELREIQRLRAIRDGGDARMKTQHSTEIKLAEFGVLLAYSYVHVTTIGGDQCAIDQGILYYPPGNEYTEFIIKPLGFGLMRSSILAKNNDLRIKKSEPTMADLLMTIEALERLPEDMQIATQSQETLDVVGTVYQSHQRHPSLSIKDYKRKLEGEVQAIISNKLFRVKWIAGALVVMALVFTAVLKMQDPEGRGRLGEGIRAVWNGCETLMHQTAPSEEAPQGVPKAGKTSGDTEIRRTQGNSHMTEEQFLQWRMKDMTPKEREEFLKWWKKEKEKNLREATQKKEKTMQEKTSMLIRPEDQHAHDNYVQFRRIASARRAGQVAKMQVRLPQKVC